MIRLKIWPACLECLYSKVEISERYAAAYIKCQHEKVCKLIEGEEPIIDSYQSFSSEEKNETR